MEQPKNDKSEQLSDDFLREEIRQLEEVEIAKEEKEEYANPHLTNKSNRVADNLTSEDLNVFREFKNHTLSPGKFNAYRNRVRLGRISLCHPRGRFIGYLGNLLSDMENMKWYDQETYQKIINQPEGLEEN